MAKLLDYVLGADKHHKLYKKAELKSFLQFHKSTTGGGEDESEEPLRDDEITILNGVLELNTKNVEMIMTPLRVSWCTVGFFGEVVLMVWSFGVVGCCDFEYG